MESEDELIFVSEAAQRLHMGPSTVREACRRYVQRLAGGDPDLLPRANELRCMSIPRGGKHSYLIRANDLALFHPHTLGDGRRGWIAGKPRSPEQRKPKKDSSN